MNTSDVFLKAALYESCRKSNILKNIDLSTASSVELRDLLNKDIALLGRTIPIIFAKYFSKQTLQMLTKKIPAIGNYVDYNTINVDIEADEAAYLINSESTYKPNIYFIVAKNITLGFLNTSVSQIKDSLTTKLQNADEDKADSVRSQKIRFAPERESEQPILVSNASPTYTQFNFADPKFKQYSVTLDDIRKKRSVETASVRSSTKSVLLNSLRSISDAESAPNDDDDNYDNDFYEKENNECPVENVADDADVDFETADQAITISNDAIQQSDLQNNAPDFFEAISVLNANNNNDEQHNKFQIPNPPVIVSAKSTSNPFGKNYDNDKDSDDNDSLIAENEIESFNAFKDRIDEFDNYLDLWAAINHKCPREHEFFSLMFELKKTNDDDKNTITISGPKKNLVKRYKNCVKNSVKNTSSRVKNNLIKTLKRFCKKLGKNHEREQ